MIKVSKFKGIVPSSKFKAMFVEHETIPTDMAKINKTETVFRMFQPLHFVDEGSQAVCNVIGSVWHNDQAFDHSVYVTSGLNIAYSRMK